MSNLIEEQDVKSQMFPFGAFKFTDPGADTTPTLSLKSPWTWSANPAFTTVTNANGTVATTDPYVQYYYSTGNSDRTCTLPAATGTGQIVAMYKTDAGTGDIDVTPAGTDKINGLNAVWKINGQFQYVVLQDRAAGEWHVLDCLGTLLEFASNGVASIISPASGVWGNPAGHVLSITPGYWMVKYKVCVQSGDDGSVIIIVYATLSTANNSESDVSWSSSGLFQTDHAAANCYDRDTFYCEKPLLVAATTPYYLNIKGYSNIGGALSLGLSTVGTDSGTLISARRIA